MKQAGIGAELSLVRRRSAPRVVGIEATPVSVEIDLAATALVVIDMQNDFLHPRGWFAARGVDAAPVAAAVPAIERLTAAMRDVRVPVVWVNWGVRGDCANVPFGTLAQGRASGAGTYGERSPSGRGHILVRDQWGAAIIDELTVGPDDLIVHKHRLSGFWDNELDSLLRRRGITTLLFAGINTDRCVFSTLQDANFLGYDCLLVEDASATVSPDYVRDAVLYLVRTLHGAVTTTDAIFAAIGQPDPAPLPSATDDIRSAP